MRHKVVVVTGGARGIGGATAQLLVEQGARVLVGDVRRPDWPAEYVETDVTDEASCKRLMDGAVERWGRIDALVHAAGILKGAMLTVDQLEAGVFDEVISVNLRGAFLCAKHAAAHMRRQGAGVIALIASGAGVRGGSSSVAYGSSKGGVHGLALVLEPQLAPDGIRVHAVCPGSLATELKLDNVADVARARGEDPVEARERAKKELGDPMGVARILAWLVSDDADYVRGTIFTR